MMTDAEKLSRLALQVRELEHELSVDSQTSRPPSDSTFLALRRVKGVVYGEAANGRTRGKCLRCAGDGFLTFPGSVSEMSGRPTVMIETCYVCRGEGIV